MGVSTQSPLKSLRNMLIVGVLLVVAAPFIGDFMSGTDTDDDQIREITVVGEGGEIFITVQAEIISNRRGSLLNVHRQESVEPFVRMVAVQSGENVTAFIRVWVAAPRGEDSFVGCRILVDGDVDISEREPIRSSSVNRTRDVLCKQTYFL